MAGYIRHLLVAEMRNNHKPKYILTAKSEKNLEEALKNINKSVLVDDIEDFFDKL